MRKNALLLVSLICLIVTSSYTQSLIMGCIQFPKELPSVPSVRIYYSGKIIKTTPDHEQKKIHFSLPKFGRQFRYSIVITPLLEFAKNTKADTPIMIDFMKLPNTQNYKMFTLLLMPKFQDPEDTDAKLEYAWRVKDDWILNKDHKIPDDAIIICMDPQWIDHIGGATEYELPTVYVKSNVVNICGSSDNFYDQSAKILLAAMDSDAFHNASEEPYIKQKENCIMIAAPVV
jgi:hypothetical protein